MQGHHQFFRRGNRVECGRILAGALLEWRFDIQSDEFFQFRCVGIEGPVASDDKFGFGFKSIAGDVGLLFYRLQFRVYLFLFLFFAFFCQGTQDAFFGLLWGYEG